MDDAARLKALPTLRPGDPVRAKGQVAVLDRIVGTTAIVTWPGGGKGYVMLADIAPALPEACSLDEAHAFVQKAERDAAALGGTLIATPLRVLRALAGAAKEADDERRAG